MADATTIPAEVRERVRRGAELLDREWPTWAAAIDPPALDLGSCELCILGQIYGDFDLGLDDLFPRRFGDEEARRHGFMTLESEEEHDLEAYRVLTAAWREEIAGRLAEGSGVANG